MNRRAFLKGLGAGIASVGCAGGAAPPAPAKPTGATPAPTTAPAPAAAASPGSAPRTAEIAKVRLAQSAPGLVYAPIYIANVRELWADMGLEVEWQQVQGGQLALSALVSNDVQFMATASSDVVLGVERGLPLIGVAGITSALTLGVAARREWLESKGVSRASPIRERVLALKGAQIGAGTAGGGPVQYLKFMLQRYGLDPERDAEFLGVGQGAARVGAMRQGLVDLLIGGAPDAELAEAEGFAAMYINMATDDPFFEDLVFTVLSTTTEYAERNPEAVRRVVQAVGRANNLLRDDPAAAAAALKQAMPEIAPRVLDDALANIQAAYPRDAAMSESMWRNAAEVLSATGAIARQPAVTDGELWTNRYTR
jgi:NitT/TauT family transport system substrate-binding protein